MVATGVAAGVVLEPDDLLRLDLDEAGAGRQRRRLEALLREDRLTWSGVTAGSSNRISQRVPPV